MRVLRSKLGWLLVATYGVAFVAAYLDAMAKRGTWLYDIGLNLLAIPYLVVGRLLLGQPSFEVHANDRGDWWLRFSSAARWCCCWERPSSMRSGARVEGSDE
jgi:hypothetical protein